MNAGYVMKLTSSALRGVIVPREGYKLVVSDLSNIEGRVQAWLAGEEWKLQAFREFDAGTGPDLYKLAYSKSFGIPHTEVTKDQRQVGKVQELALGYEGGVGAFLTFSLAYNIDLEAMADEAWDTLPGDLVHDAGRYYDWIVSKGMSTYGLSRNAFITCDVFKRGWRRGHPNIHATWRLLEETAIEAVNHPGVTLHAGRFRIRRDGAWLRISLPSGRCLCYPQPLVRGNKLSYMGMNQYSRRWQRLNTYGGKLFENACQSLARDILIDAMPGIEDAGYSIVLHVHDEVITEAPDTPEFNAEHLSSLLATNPSWAPDIPLAAAGFESYRYRKD